MIDRAAADFLVDHIRIVARQERARAIAIGIVTTHVHVLLRLHPTTNLPRLLQRLKGGSSVMIARQQAGSRHPLKWDKGYNLESVSVRATPRVIEYVRDQPQHHPGEAIPDWAPTPDTGVGPSL